MHDRGDNYPKFGVTTVADHPDIFNDTCPDMSEWSLLLIELVGINNIYNIGYSGYELCINAMPTHIACEATGRLCSSACKVAMPTHCMRSGWPLMLFFLQDCSVACEAAGRSCSYRP
jgi:hypothetical protein